LERTPWHTAKAPVYFVAEIEVTNPDALRMKPFDCQAAKP